jgi:predicted small metal-binding protein
MARELGCSVCSFTLRTDDDSELVSIHQVHAKSHHGKILSADSILARAKSV